MTDKLTLRKSKSPLLVPRNQLLHSSVPLKVWVKLDSKSVQPTDINQPIAIEFEESDTVDDLKNHIFSRLENTRWALENDAAGICIGFWCGCSLNSGDNSANVEALKEPWQDSISGSPKSVNVDLCRGPSTAWQLSRAGSPRAAAPLAPSPHAPYKKLQVPGQVPTPLNHMRISAKQERVTPSPTYIAHSRRPLRHALMSKEFSQTEHQVIFEPDELVINVCNNLFGGVSMQTAADALTIFFNVKEREPPFLENELDDLGIVDENIDDNESEPREDYKLIISEEQLRRLGHAIDEDNPDCHKQAILLLPKNFDGDFNLPSPALSSPSVTTSKASTAVNSPLGMAAPLVEEEIGLVPSLDPRVQREGSPLSFGLEAVSAAFVTRDKLFPRINVLIVEDNVINQAILGSFLRKHKIAYKVANNGREAVDKWKEGGMHLILMDLQLPLLSGVDAAKEIRQLESLNGIGKRRIRKRQPPSRTNSSTKLSKRETPHRKVVSEDRNCDEEAEAKAILSKDKSKVLDRNLFKAPVIIVALTASNSESDKTEALLAGCNDYLTKPVNLDWLSNKITEWGCMQALIDFDSWNQGQRKKSTGSLAKSSAPSRLPAAPSKTLSKGADP